MKRIILILLAAGLFSTAHAQDKALLYEVSGKDLAKPSYLYGTLHQVCPNDLQLSAATRKALTDSQQLYLEIDFDDPALTGKMITGMMMPGGKTVRDLLSPEDYAVLNTYMESNVGVGLGMMGMMKPVALSALIYVGMLKCDPASYDLTFARLAGEGGKEVLGLETFEEQMAVLDSIPVEDQLKDLVEMARNPADAQKELASLLAAYKAQDITQLMKLIDDSSFESPEFKDDLLDKRNANWIPVIEKAAQQKPTFFAFGAGHLGGDKGVLSLLRKKGYTVQPLP
jgi:uncharacterized protein